jgi:hypothetical protein
MDFYAILPYAAAIVFVSFALFVVWNYIKTKKMPPTDEPMVGDYRIELDVGTHFVSFEGTLYYFNKLLNPQHLHAYDKTIPDKKIRENLESLHKTLKKDAYFYAMRVGIKKLAFISLNHPIEVAPYFKSEQGTGKKVVHATGFIGKPTRDFQPITIIPIDLSKNTLNPTTFDSLNHTGQLLMTLHEKAPLLEEISAKEQQLRVFKSKVDDMDDEIGKLTDEKEWWKHLAKKLGYSGEPSEEKGFTLPAIIKTFAPYGLLFIVGYAVSPHLLPQTEYHPALLGGVLVAIGFVGKWLIQKFRK